MIWRVLMAVSNKSKSNISKIWSGIFLKTVFHKFYLVHLWTLCSILWVSKDELSRTKQKSLTKKYKINMMVPFNILGFLNVTERSLKKSICSLSWKCLSKCSIMLQEHGFIITEKAILFCSLFPFLRSSFQEL